MQYHDSRDVITCRFDEDGEDGEDEELYVKSYIQNDELDKTYPIPF